MSEPTGINGKENGSSGVIDVKDEQAPVKSIQYKKEAGDQYEVGDCYERGAISQDWELDT
jgi:hypothetical protein